MNLHRVQKMFARHKYFWLGAPAIIVVVTMVWFCTPVPTFAARYAWNEWRAGMTALALDRTDAELAFAIGDYYFGNQAAIGTTGERPYDLPLAERAFGKAVAIDPSIQAAHYMRARIEFIRSDFNAALTDLDTELALHPENKRALYMRGLTYAYRARSGDLLLAEQDFKDFVAWAPREWAGYNDLAFVLAKGVKYAEAEKVLKEGIAKADGGDKNPWLWTALGVMQLNLHEAAAAVTSLTRAQTYAAALSEIDWQRAYPGNNPSSAFAESGIEAMKIGIAKDLIAAYAALKK